MTVGEAKNVKKGDILENGQSGVLDTDYVAAKSVLSEQVGGSHYSSKAIQPIDYIEKNGLGFCEGNVVKYITRHKDKNGAEDIKKVIQYCKFILAYQYGIEE